VAGAAVSWLKDGLRFINRPEETEPMALSVPDTAGVYFVPAFTGLATPEWDPYARGAFLGLTAIATREHMVRAVLEGIAMQSQHCFQAMQQGYNAPIEQVFAGGGMTDNTFLMQLHADLFGVPMIIPAEKETAAFGSAGLARFGIGDLDSISHIREHEPIRCEYIPKMSADERTARLATWQKALSRAGNWID